MSALEGLKSMGVVVNPPYMGVWPQKVGHYLLNFGAIELFSYQHLYLLEASRDDFNRNLDRLLAQRIDRINQLVAASAELSDEDKQEVTELWANARELAVWRNRIAHNPVLPTWKPGSDSDNSPPDLLGVPDMRQLKASNITDSISLEGMDKLINASAELGGKLHAISKKLGAT